jgi:hypothetical protein
VFFLTVKHFGLNFFFCVCQPKTFLRDVRNLEVLQDSEVLTAVLLKIPAAKAGDFMYVIVVYQASSC